MSWERVGASVKYELPSVTYKREASGSKWERMGASVKYELTSVKYELGAYESQIRVDKCQI